MRYSKLFPKTLKQAPKDAESINHRLLVRGGFIDQLMAGSWTLLPLGWKVYLKLVSIVREELSAIDAQEMLMPLLHPKNIWDQTGRWADPAVKEIMYQFKDVHEKEYGLSFTHEEIVMDLLRKFIRSYKDLPVSIYHFSTKFRNELRAKSGILRGREFIMKDLYSAHTSEEDMRKYYEKVKLAYIKIFNRMGFDIKVVEAPGGVFTKDHTHEFQVLCPTGEDTILYCDGKGCGFAQNKEIATVKAGEKCQKCAHAGHNETIKEGKSIEVGNIFPLGTKYSKAMGVTYQDKDGKNKDVWFASYGIGMTRLIGTLAEVFHDERGIVWPESVAPYLVHLIHLGGGEGNTSEVYAQLRKAGIEVLWDDRETVSAGEKFADADLIGIPVRLVVSEKNRDKVEWKRRSEEKTKLLTMEEIVEKLKGE